MKRALFSLTALGLFFAVQSADAAPLALTYAHDHHIFTLTVRQTWSDPASSWTFRGIPAVPTFCDGVCDDEAIPEGWVKTTAVGWNRDAIRADIETRIAKALFRDAGSVTISRTASGAIAFDGRGITGRRVDIDAAITLTIAALENNIANVVIPVVETPARVTVTDPDLQSMGIREVVTVGESNFAGSPVNRRHNIAVGLSKFDGTLIPQGATFSFNEVLGPVDATTGYRKELVIQGDRTIPDYGGGLCQISSTAYRGIWEYGFPIAKRKNHSYTVSYYSPQGTDATIYPPSVDMQFVNDSSGALLMQTFTDESDHAYYVYYGTKDDRKSEIFGPYVWGTTPAPKEKKIEYTTDIPPGTEKKLGSQVPGMNVSWFRVVEMPDAKPEVLETYSAYAARPLFYQVGVTAEELSSMSADASAAAEPPSWLPIQE